MLYKIAIVDDRPSVLHALALEINYYPEIEVVFTSRNGEEFLQRLKELPVERHPQVVLMDIDMPVLNGIETVRKGSSLYEHIQYIMLTVVDDDDKLFDAIRAGADGYLLKEERVDAVLAAIKEVVDREGAPMSPRIARKALNFLAKPETSGQDTWLESLSARETQILKWMVEGLDYKQIGEKLFISPHTVRNHIAKVYNKLHISSRIEAVKVAMKNNLV